MEREGKEKGGFGNDRLPVYAYADGGKAACRLIYAGTLMQTDRCRPRGPYLDADYSDDENVSCLPSLSTISTCRCPTTQFPPVAWVSPAQCLHCYTVHCKNIRISTHILWRVFRILTEPVPYSFVSVNRRNNEARAHIAISASGFVMPPIYGFKRTRNRGSVKIWKKLATKYAWIYIYGYVFAVYTASTDSRQMYEQMQQQNAAA